MMICVVCFSISALHRFFFDFSRTDACHQNSAKIKDANGEAVYMGHVTAMCSSTEQIAWSKPVASLSLKEVEKDWRDLDKRAQERGKPVSWQQLVVNVYPIGRV